MVRSKFAILGLLAALGASPATAGDWSLGLSINDGYGSAGSFRYYSGDVYVVPDYYYTPRTRVIVVPGSRASRHYWDRHYDLRYGNRHHGHGHGHHRSYGRVEKPGRH